MCARPGCSADSNGCPCRFRRTAPKFLVGEIATLCGFTGVAARYNNSAATVIALPDNVRNYYVVEISGGRRRYVKEEQMQKTHGLISPECHTAKVLAWFHKTEPVMKAYLKGEPIQRRAAGTDESWENVGIPRWRTGLEYRVKPQPVSFPVWICTTPYNDSAFCRRGQLPQKVMPGDRSFTAPPADYAKFWRKVEVQEVL